MMCERCGLEILPGEHTHTASHCIYRLKAEMERLHDKGYDYYWRKERHVFMDEIKALRSQLADRDKLLGECLSILEFHSSGQASDIGNRIQSTLDGKPKHPCWKCGGEGWIPHSGTQYATMCRTCHGTGLGDCPDCGDDGEPPNRDCPTCEGKG